MSAHPLTKRGKHITLAAQTRKSLERYMRPYLKLTATRDKARKVNGKNKIGITMKRAGRRGISERLRRLATGMGAHGWYMMERVDCDKRGTLYVDLLERKPDRTPKGPLFCARVSLTQAERLLRDLEAGDTYPLDYLRRLRDAAVAAAMNKSPYGRA